MAIVDDPGRDVAFSFPYGPGGSGGAGGFGAAFAAGGTATNTGTVAGGAGGAGGAGSSAAYPGGAGGAGGDGLYSLAGLTLTNTGTITGGNGGAGGSRGLAYAGADGTGGAGVRGRDLTIDNRGGTISGGLAGDGVARNFAIVMTGGSNQISGGTLVGGLSVEGTATFQPALNTAPVGTPLTVTGPVVFAPGTTYQVRITPAASDSVVATGAATLGGAAVSVLAGQTTYAPSTRYTILTAAGGLNGRFGTVFTNLAFLTPALSYDGQNVFLTVTATTQPDPGTPTQPTNPATPTDPGQPTTPATPVDPGGPGTPTPPPSQTPLAFRSVAVTRNQVATANAIQALGRGALYDAVLSSSAAGARQAFDAASGEIHSSAVTAQFDTAYLVREAILDRLRFGEAGAIAGGSGAQGVGQRFAPGTTLPATYTADLPGRAPALSNVPAQFVERSPIALWGQGFGSFGSVGGNGNAARLDQQTSGFVLGADTRIDEAWRLGVAGGYTYTNLDVTGRQSTGTVESGFGALYAGASLGPTQLRFGGSYAGSSYDLRRAVTFAGFSESERGRYGGDLGQAFGEIGYRIGSASGYVEPFVGGAAIRLSRDGFTERGGVAALTAARRDYDLATSTVGIQAQGRLDAIFNSATPILIRGLVGYRRAYGDVVPSSLLTFGAAGQPFQTAGVPIARSALVAQGGLDWQVSPATTLSVAYTGQLGSQQTQDHGVKGSFVYRW